MTRPSRLLAGTLLLSFVLIRTWLAITPDADLYVGSYNVHPCSAGS